MCLRDRSTYICCGDRRVACGDISGGIEAGGGLARQVGSLERSEDVHVDLRSPPDDVALDRAPKRTGLLLVVATREHNLGDVSSLGIVQQDLTGLAALEHHELPAQLHRQLLVERGGVAVSYTHLTLPTNREV